MGGGVIDSLLTVSNVTCKSDYFPACTDSLWMVCERGGLNSLFLPTSAAHFFLKDDLILSSHLHLLFICEKGWPDSLLRPTFALHLYIKGGLILCLYPQFIDLRLAVLGNVDAGKSTLLGVLTQGELDNGRGCARLNLFRHLHEIQSGRTSSISYDILGFDTKGQVESSVVFPPSPMIL